MTAIEWTDVTWNPTTGCDRVSPGCDHCYALTMAGRLKRMGQPKYQADGDPRTSGPGFALTEHPDSVDAPLSWRKPRKVFVNSMSDLFHQDVTDDFIARVFAVMALTPEHTYQVLTKRPQRMAMLLGSLNWWGSVAYESGLVSAERGLPTPAWIDGLRPLSNVWLGTSIESNRYTFRADHLRATPAAVRFISAEPLIGPLPSLDLTDIDWLIVGGESGPGARPMHPDWVRDLREACVEAGYESGGPQGWVSQRVAFFFKQWGAWWPATQPNDLGGLGAFVEPDGSWRPDYMALPSSDAQHVIRLGKHAAGRDLDGRTWDEYPAVAERVAS